MTISERKGLMLDALQTASKIVESYEKPYSDLAWDKFFKRVDELYGSTEEIELRTTIHKIISVTMDYCCKDLLAEEKSA